MLIVLANLNQFWSRWQK